MFLRALNMTKVSIPRKVREIKNNLGYIFFVYLIEEFEFLIIRQIRSVNLTMVSLGS